jgi:hypothetical protein
MRRVLLVLATLGVLSFATHTAVAYEHGGHYGPSGYHVYHHPDYHPCARPYLGVPVQAYYGAPAPYVAAPYAAPYYAAPYPVVRSAGYPYPAYYPPTAWVGVRGPRVGISLGF